MKKTPLFTPVDFASWNRAEIFYYFYKMAPTGYSLTVKLDVTDFGKTLRHAGLKFFPAYLWLVTKNLNSFTEFRTAEVDGTVGHYDFLTPLYATFHDDDKTFSLMWTEYDEDFGIFYDEYINNQDTFGQNHGILARKGEIPPPNAYTVSCIPWVDFEHFAVHSNNQKPYFFPSVEAGKFTEENGRLMMPLSVTCHHAATDGYHVSEFIKALQSGMDGFDKYIS